MDRKVGKRNRVVGRARPNVFFDRALSPQDQEERVARVVGGRRVPGSGASMFAKGDVRSEHFLVECKRTEHASLSLKKEWLDKISAEAATEGREPALAIEIAGGALSAHGEREWIMIPLRIFRKLTGEEE